VSSWRRMRISMSLAAVLRASNLSQPNRAQGQIQQSEQHSW
jgi:hypothetical protein